MSDKTDDQQNTVTPTPASRVDDPAAADQTSENRRDGAQERRDPNASEVGREGHVRREVLFGELHLRLLEQYGPPSIVVNESHDIVHLSEGAGRYLHFVAGEPTANVVKAINRALQIELHAALFRAEQIRKPVKTAPQRIDIEGGSEVITLEVRPMRATDQAQGFFLVLFEKQSDESATPVAPVSLRKHAEEEVGAGAVRYRTLFELVPVAVYTTDADGVIQEFNHRSIELWGRTPDPAGEKFCGSFKMYRPDGTPMPHDECPMARVLRGDQLDPADLELMVEQKNGTRRNVVVAPRALKDHSGTIVGAINCVHDITQRKRAEEALRESEERFRTVADNIPQIIWTNDAAGDANYFNRRWHEYTGLNDEQSMGLGWQTIVHPEDKPASAERWQKALAAGNVFDVEYRLRRHDGVYRWHLGRNVPLRDYGRIVGWFGSATDIEDFKRAEAALYESDERFRLLVEGTRDYAMFLLAPDNRITFWSKGAERIFGWTQEEAVGQSGDLIFTPEDRAKGAVQKEIDIASRDGAAPDRRYHLRKDGTRFWTDGVLMRLDAVEGDGLRGFAKIARDATEQRQHEEALGYARDQLEQRVLERTADLMATNNELERTMAQREQLERELLEISERERRRIGQDLHDIICQELTATALFLKSTANSVGDEAGAKSLTEAAEIVNRNVALARDLARGFQPVMLGPGGLPAALRSLCRHADQRGIRCDLKLPRAVRIRDESLALNLFRIAQEAVRNAVSHSGGSEITLCIEREDNLIRLVVEDNGKGFRQRKRSKGLGLHIMKYRANMLGGSLNITSPANGGTRMVCEVPSSK